MRSTTTPKYKLSQRLVYYYFCVRSEFFKCYTFSKRQVISRQWPLRTLLCPELKHKISVKARLNPSSGKDALTMFSLWEKGRETTNQFVLEANTHHPTIKCVCFMSGASQLRRSSFVIVMLTRTFLFGPEGGYAFSV